VRTPFYFHIKFTYNVFQGDKNNGFDVLYHNMKHGQISTKELADFIRESVTIEDTYSRSMTKLAKTSSNYSQLGTFAPLWDVLKSSTEKLASSHLDLVRKLQELIKEVQKYGDEQTKAHKKTKEEVAGTLEAVQNIQSITQTLQKSKENYNTKCLEYERLKKEGATQKEVEKAVVKSKKATETYKLYVEKYATARTDFEQKMTETAQKFQEIEEAHLRHMKEILRCFAYSIDETHIQIGQVHEELVQNMESTTVESLIQKLAETKGTGKDRPGKSNILYLRKIVSSLVFNIFLLQNIPEVDEEGFCIKPEVNQNDILNFNSQIDSGSDDEEPRKFHVEIKPMQPNNGTNHTLEELKASIGNLTLSPSQSVSKSLLVLAKKVNSDLFSLDPLFGPPLDSSSSSTSTTSSVSPPARPTTPHNAGGLVPPPRPASRPKLSSGKLGGIDEMSRSFSPPAVTSTSPPPVAPLARAESTSSIGSSASLSAATTPTVDDDVFIGKLPSFEKRCETPAGTSRGPSPISLGSQDSLPVATAFTESVNAYFKGADPTKCIVKITGDMTMSFPSGIIKIFTSNPSPAVLSFRIRNTSKLEQILPNSQLVFSDLSQSDSNTKDFWMNMQTLTAYLKKLAEQNPSASYYNVDILKYQVSSNGILSTPLNLATYWKCTLSTTDVRVDYKYNPEAMVIPSVLSNVQVLMPVDGGVTCMQSLPTAVWNAEQKKALWKLSEISEKSDDAGTGSLRAKFDITEGPSKPSTLAVQFISEGSTLSGVDMELVGTGYRLSLIKKRFATGRYMADC
uniref:FCH and mu domain containing endocytic adaptor 2 n=1 Tax=Callorhinchus milii TaxID=7868 RepID=A0A4W3HMI9_CALMI